MALRRLTRYDWCFATKLKTPLGQPICNGLHLAIFGTEKDITNHKNYIGMGGLPKACQAAANTSRYRSSRYQ